MKISTALKRSARRLGVLSLTAAVVGLGAALLPSAAMAQSDSVVITSPTEGAVLHMYAGTLDPPVAEGDLLVSFTAAGAPTTCSLDGQLPFACTSPATFPHVAAGPHSVTVTAGAAVATTSFEVQVFMLAPPPEVDFFPMRSVTARWLVRERRTSVRLLRLDGLPRRTHVRLTCSGAGCPQSSYTTTARGRLDLTSFFRGHVLRSGARVCIALRSRGRQSVTYRYTMQRGLHPMVAIS